jgi:hypothetical protein
MLRMALVRSASLLLVLALLACGCGPRHYKMLIGAPRDTFAVGATARGYVSLMQVNYATDQWRTHTLERVACDDGACDTAIEAPSADGYGSTFTVTPRRAGDLVVHVTARTDDGDEAEDAVTIHAADIAEVALGRAFENAGADGVALLVGASTQLRFQAAAADGTALDVGDLAELSVSGPALENGPQAGVHIDRDSDLTFTAKNVGAAVVTVNVGAFGSSRTIRVASASDVKRVTLHRLSYDPPALEVGPGWEPRALADELALGPRQRSVQIVPVSELADGTTAIGGAEGCTTDATARDASLSSPHDGQWIELQGRADADVTVTCTVGSAVASATVKLMDYVASYDP